MNKDQFWQIVDKVSQLYSDRDQESRMCRTMEELIHCSLEDIVDWHLILSQYCSAAYRPELAAAGAVLGADYRGDGFIDFACWLVSCGKEAYMNALRDPATLFEIPLTDKSPSFRQLRFTAYNAYDTKLFLTDPGEFESGDLSTALRNHTLDPQTVQDIHNELPQCSEVARKWQDQVFPIQAPIPERLRNRDLG